MYSETINEDSSNMKCNVSNKGPTSCRPNHVSSQCVLQVMFYKFVCAQSGTYFDAILCTLDLFYGCL